MKAFLLIMLLGMATDSLAESPRQKLILIPSAASPVLPEPNGDESSDEANTAIYQGNYTLVEEFTANTLGRSEFKLGSEIEAGITDKLMAGADTWSLFMGIPTGHGKFLVYQNEHHKVAVGIKSVWLTLGNLADFAPAKDYFRYLNAKIIRPSISWTNSLSPRLKLHTFWAARIGKVEAELSEKGQRRFWEAKHPGGDYETRTTDSPDGLGDDPSPTPASNSETTAGGADDEVKSDKNQAQKGERLSAVSRRTLELQSLFGLSTDRFQIAGEYVRNNGNKILFSTRIERMAMEKLKANSLTLTIAQQWVAGSFQFRLGIGVQYLSLTGRDLDGEQVDEAGITPVPQVAFYWRF